MLEEFLSGAVVRGLDEEICNGPASFVDLYANEDRSEEISIF